MLISLEAEPKFDDFFEIKIYLTGKLKEDEVVNLAINHNKKKDALTSLRSQTHYGRPNLDAIFPQLVEDHHKVDIGVFFCGPKPLARSLLTASLKYSTHNGTKFIFNKERF